MADTALTLITDALLDLGVLSDNETPSSSMAAGALRKLNNLIDSWNTDGLIPFQTVSYVIPLAAGKGVYTIGPTGDVVTSAPANIQSVFVRDNNLPLSGQYDYELDILNDQEWQTQVPFKSEGAAFPYNAVWINYTAPNVSINLNPIPSGSQYSLVVWLSGVLSSYQLASVLVLPPGLWRALESNLAIELASSYAVEPSAALVKIANESLATYKINNVELNEMQTPFGGRYNILTNRGLRG